MEQHDQGIWMGNAELANLIVVGIWNLIVNEESTELQPSTQRCEHGVGFIAEVAPRTLVPLELGVSDVAMSPPV